MKGFNRFSSFALFVLCLVLLQHHGLQFFLNEFSGKATSEDAILKAAVQEAAKITDRAKEDAQAIRQTALAKAQAEIKQMTARALATLPKTGRWLMLSRGRIVVTFVRTGQAETIQAAFTPKVRGRGMHHSIVLGF